MKKLFCVVALFGLTLSASPGAGAETISASSEPTTSAFRSALEDEIDEEPGETTIFQSESATIFSAEDPDLVVDPAETRWRINSYSLDYSFEECASYEIAANFTFTAEGPDLLEAPYFIFGLVNSDDELLAGGGVEGPSEIGQSVTDGVSESFDGGDIVDGLNVVYLTLTAVNAPGFVGSFGTTYSVPTIELDEDRTDCPPETTTTTKAPSTTTTTTPPASPKPSTIKTNNSAPPAGGSMTLTGSGYKPLSEVQLTIGNTSVGKTTTNNEGSFSTEIKLPANLEGNQTITATGTNPDGTPRVEVLGISITPAPNYGAAPTSLAATGTGIQLSLIGATLSALGLLSLTLRRKLANN